VDARERATDKARIAALESQLADERRQFAARRGELERDEAQVKLHSIDTAAGTWRPNAPADVNAICAKLAEGGKAALELARVRELAKHGYITGWSVMASDPRQVAELAELRKLLGMG
jgi:multidrug resistance efflux pump